MKNQAIRFLKRAVGLLLRLPILLRATALSVPGLSRWAENRLSLQSVITASPGLAEAARHAQFREWHPEDLVPRITYYGESNVRIAAKEFFEAYLPAEGRSTLLDMMQALTPEIHLLIYAPHAFAFDAGEKFSWVPRWEEIASLADSVPGLRLLDFNPGFDRNGFFHVLLEKESSKTQENNTLGQAGYYFYSNVGTSRNLGASASVLSATGFRALKRIRPSAREYSFLARVPEEVQIGAGDIAMGHYGPWLTDARRSGALTILYGPGDRFRKERHDGEFYERLQIRGNFDAQYRAAHMTIMQAGGRWRTADAWPYQGLCRWMDLPVSPAVFPRTKKRIAPPGQRVFCFIGLYDDYQKGLDTAHELCRRCPDFRFIAVGCKPIGVPNCREYRAVDNRLPQFRRIVQQADFIVSPARDDAQPGTIAECSSLGLLPIITETTGYVLSFPRRMNADDWEQCAAVLREAQAADPEKVIGWQALNAKYIEQFHRPQSGDILLNHYLTEALEEFAGKRA